MNEEIIKKLAEAFIMMRTDGMNIEKTISSAMGICDATRPNKSKIRALREEVLWFATEMEVVLQENNHKGGWVNCHVLDLLSKLQEEISELITAIREGESEDVIKECVDIANYAMMIADNSRE